MVRCESKNIHQTNMCLEKIGLCAQRLLTIMDVILDIIEDIFNHLTII